MSAARRLLGAYPELVAVVLAAAIGLSVRAPLSWLARHDAIDVLLAALVLATATTIEPVALRRIGADWRPVAAAVVLGVTVLPALAWAVSHLVTAGPLRDGVAAVGVAPCEIASIATTAMAGGEAQLAAGVLVGSTVAAVVAAGPLLGLEAGHASVDTTAIAVNLLEVVVAPFAAGVAVRVLTGTSERRERLGGGVALGSVAALVALIAAEVTLSSAYVGVVVALVVFMGGSFALGVGVGRIRAGGASRRGAATAVLLTLSMRDFAIAAAIAASAFGRGAAAPLGIYGVLVLVLGTATAGRLRGAQPQP